MQQSIVEPTTPNGFSERDTVFVSTAQVSTELEGEVVILNVDDGMYYGLKAVSGRLWELIREPITIGHLCEILVQEFEVEPGTCAREVNGLLRSLQGKGLIEVRHETA